MEEEKANNNNYSLEDLLEMLGGYQYFSEDQILYTYYKLKGEHDIANIYLENCKREAEKLQQKYIQMSKENEKIIEENISTNV